jgi:hypothetical protein
MTLLSLFQTAWLQLARLWSELSHSGCCCPAHTGKYVLVYEGRYETACPPRATLQMHTTWDHALFTDDNAYK